MKERPILFSSEMVQAILDGRKSQTRRVIKPQPPRWTWNHIKFDDRCINVGTNDPDDSYYVICPYGQPGDRLWVRETISAPMGKLVYKADIWNDIQGVPGHPECQWIPSIFMPRWASRITLEVVNVRVERVQDISYKDARAEGMPCEFSGEYDFHAHQVGGYQANFRRLWDQLNKARGYGWDENPWVWVIEFRKVD